MGWRRERESVMQFSVSAKMGRWEYMPFRKFMQDGIFMTVWWV